MILQPMTKPEDPEDRVGPRCAQTHPDVGICHRRADHQDPWHHAVTGAAKVDGQLTGQFWRWRDDDPCHE